MACVKPWAMEGKVCGPWRPHGWVRQKRIESRDSKRGQWVMGNERYWITPVPGIRVGHASDGRQVILGPMPPEMVAYVFDRGGRFIRRERRLWRMSVSRSAPRQGPGPLTSAEYDEVMSDWMGELKMTERPVRVEGFFDHELYVGIEEVPACLLQGPMNESAQAQVEREGARLKWIQSGTFVFWWELDHWMDWDKASG